MASYLLLDDPGVGCPTWLGRSISKRRVSGPNEQMVVLLVAAPTDGTKVVQAAELSPREVFSGGSRRTVPLVYAVATR